MIVMICREGTVKI